jgi:hypothetical protein
VAHLQFLPTHKSTLKNAKELPNQSTETGQTINETTTTYRRAACNQGLAKVVFQCSKDTFVVKMATLAEKIFD